MSHSAAAPLRTLRLAVAGVVAIAVLEIGGGLLSGSLALLSDAGHLVTDSATLGLTWFALARAQRPAGARHTFGHHRGGIVVAALNGLVLVLIAAAIAVGAIGRLQHPTTLHPVTVILVAAVALVANAAIAAALRSAGGGLGLRSAALHVVADALTDAAVIAGALATLALGWTAADAVVSLLIAGLIVAGAVRLLAEALQILNEGTPRDVDADAVRRRIGQVPGVDGVHDLHIWSIDREHRALSVHVSVADRPMAEVTMLIRTVERVLCSEFAIEHATVQPECPSCTEAAELYCDLPTHHQRAHREVPAAVE